MNIKTLELFKIFRIRLKKDRAAAESFSSNKASNLQADNERNIVYRERENRENLRVVGLSR